MERAWQNCHVFFGTNTTSETLPPTSTLGLSSTQTPPISPPLRTLALRSTRYHCVGNRDEENRAFRDRRVVFLFFQDLLSAVVMVISANVLWSTVLLWMLLATSAVLASPSSATMRLMEQVHGQTHHDDSREQDPYQQLYGEHNCFARSAYILIRERTTCCCHLKGNHLVQAVEYPACCLQGSEDLTPNLDLKRYIEARRDT